MKLFYPDKNLKIIKYYHMSSKILIPSILYSAFCHYKDFKITPIIDSMCITNIGFHSYVSVSSVIHDYIKPKNINNIARIMNTKLHILAFINYIYASNVYKI